MVSGADMAGPRDLTRQTRLTLSGIFGTPNYVINGEIFWGQDRLWMVEQRVKELVAARAKPRKY